MSEFEFERSRAEAMALVTPLPELAISAFRVTKPPTPRGRVSGVARVKTISALDDAITALRPGIVVLIPASYW
jgi:hypothetical protein